MADLALRALTLLDELERLGAKVDVIHPDGFHRYWSTHCRHNNHDDCSAAEISGIEARRPGEWRVAVKRTPASCKTCAAPCVCPCHQEGAGS